MSFQKERGKKEMSEKLERAYKDNFSASEKGFLDLLELVKEIESGDRWFTVPAKGIRFEALPKEPMYLDSTALKFNLTDDEKDVLSDTMKGSGLVVNIEGTFYFVRDCAIRTIYERAKISGNALGRLTRENLCDVLNKCMAVSRGDALVYQSNGKVSAVHGGDKADYSKLPISNLLEVLSFELDARFPNSEFWGGYTDHTITTANWTFPEQCDTLLNNYEKELGSNNPDLVPGIKFATSNVGTSCANIYPFILNKMTRVAVRFGTGISVKHKNGKTIADFTKEIGYMYPKFINAVNALNKLMKIELFYPVNAMVEILKKISVPKKYAVEAVRLFEARNGDKPATAHDVFWAISESTFLMRADNISEYKIFLVEDSIAKALHMNWIECDIGGELAA